MKRTIVIEYQACGGTGLYKGMAEWKSQYQMNKKIKFICEFLDIQQVVKACRFVL